MDKGAVIEKKGAAIENDERLKKAIRVKVYFDKDAFASVADDAVKAGFRGKGLPRPPPLYNTITEKGETKIIANTDGISAFLKFCNKQWKLGEADRLERLAEFKRKETALAEEKKRLGIG